MRGASSVYFMRIASSMPMGRRFDGPSSCTRRMERPFGRCVGIPSHVRQGAGHAPPSVAESRVVGYIACLHMDRLGLPNGVTNEATKFIENGGICLKTKGRARHASRPTPRSLGWACPTLLQCLPPYDT